MKNSRKNQTRASNKHLDKANEERKVICQNYADENDANFETPSINLNQSISVLSNKSSSNTSSNIKNCNITDAEETEGNNKVYGNSSSSESEIERQTNHETSNASYQKTYYSKSFEKDRKRLSNQSSLTSTSGIIIEMNYQKSRNEQNHEMQEKQSTKEVSGGLDGWSKKFKVIF
jgi:hypothetical protein